MALMEKSMKINKISIGTRGSKLALWQAEWIKSELKELYPDLEIELITSPVSRSVVEGASRLDNAADEENPLVIRRKAPHNQRIEQTPFGRSSSAA
jgi:hypothetical protein